MNSTVRRFRVAQATLLGCLVAAGFASTSRADDVPPPAPPMPAPAVPTAAPTPAPTSPPRDASPVARTFATPEEAAEALVAAFESNDDAALRALLGSSDRDLVQDSRDPVVFRSRADLAQTARKKTTIERRGDGRATILVGEHGYPLAMPLVKENDRWKVDAEAGREELLARRIGEHELEAVGLCLAYADAQVAYASEDRNGDGVREYAQRILSTPGARDGLFWEAKEGEEESPAGPGLTPFKDALSKESAKSAPFDGYYWRVLTAQGSKAPGGAYSYLVNGRMLAGFALLAVPAVHRNTGVMSFLVSHHGLVYEKDLGANSIDVASRIDTFDPDSTWREVDASTLRLAAETSPADAPFLDAPPLSSDLTPSSGDALPAAAGSDATRGAPVPSTVPARDEGNAPNPPDCPGRR